MAECVVCGGDDYDLQDGLFFCSECGTQSQNAREEVTTGYVTGSQGHSIRARSSRVSRKKERFGEGVEEDGKVVHLHQLEKFQIIMKKQADALIELGFDPSVKEAMRLIWFAYLKHYGYAFVGDSNGHSKLQAGKGARTVGKEIAIPGRRNLADITGSAIGKRGRKRVCKTAKAAAGRPSKGQAQKKVSFKQPDTSGGCSFDSFPDDAHLFASEEELDGDEEEEEEEEEGKLAWRRVKSKTLSTLNPEYFMMRHTISIAYLALLYTGQHVLPVDIVRWMANNTLPYYNTAHLLARSQCSPYDAITHAKPVCSAEGIHSTASEFYSEVPLPLLPSPCARALCRSLAERLMLPESIQRMVDRAVVGVHKPHFLDCFTRLQTRIGMRKRRKRFDVECLSIVVMVLRLVYKLDDRFEMEQSLVSGSTNQSGLTPANAVYSWMDWIKLYLRHRRHTQAEVIPTSHREFERLKDYRKYLEFCKDGIFGLRSKPGKGDRNYVVYNPQWNASISEIFTAHCKRVKDRRQRQQQQKPERQGERSEEEPCDKEMRLTHSTFNPRLVPLDFTVHGLLACENYECLPQTRRYDYLQDVHLSLSMTFLLSVCCELIGVRMMDMYTTLLVVEDAFCDGSLVPMHKLLVSLTYRQESEKDDD